MHRGGLANLSSDNLGAINGNVETKNVIAVLCQLVTASSSLLGHRYLTASVELLSVVVAVMNHSKSSDHVNCFPFGIVSTAFKLKTYRFC